MKNKIWISRLISILAALIPVLVVGAFFFFSEVMNIEMVDIVATVVLAVVTLVEIILLIFKYLSSILTFLSDDVHSSK